MVYDGKHSKLGSAEGAGTDDGSYRTDDNNTTSQPPGEVPPLPDAMLRSLEKEESQDKDSSHERIQHLLGSIQLHGIRLQSPIYFEDSQRSNTTGVQDTPGAHRQDAAQRQNDAASHEDDYALRLDRIALRLDRVLPRLNHVAPQKDDMPQDDTVILEAVEKLPRDD